MKYIVKKVDNPVGVIPTKSMLEKIKENTNAGTTTPIDIPDVYEIFCEETIRDVNGKNVTIPKSLGQHILENLEDQRIFLEEQLQETIDKINAIKANQ